MKIDVSEVKTFNTCKRQWMLTSRNKFHMRPKITPPNLANGTLFHEALHSLYLGVSLDKVMQDLRKEVDDSGACLLAMVPGYAKNVLPGDLERFEVLDIEHKFEIQPMHIDDITICGSIDMICVEKDTRKIYGFEHKTAKNFRDTSYLWMDEQPRVYTIALMQYIKEKNDKLLEEWEAKGRPVEEEPVKYTLGGIYLNEVKKLLRDFQYNRTLCTYPEDDLENFFTFFLKECAACKKLAEDEDKFIAPNPGYMTCSMCSFKDMCQTYMYSTITEEMIKENWSDEFEKREEDHLDEKVERMGVPKKSN